VPVFGWVPWLPWVVFQLSFWVPLATVNAIQPPTWPSREPSDLSELKPDGPAWASLVLSALATSHKVQPPVWLSQELSDLSGLDSDSPPYLCTLSPGVFLGWFTYMNILHLLYIWLSDWI
jgi:hypothetical protein